MAKYLSKYLTYERAVYSGNAVAHGIPNTPDNTDLKNLILWGEKIYDPVCEKFGNVFLSSVFRDSRMRRDKWGKYVSVNGLAGGSPTSGHARGQCGDIDGDAPSASFVKVDNSDIFHWIRTNLEFDQLIAEYEADGSPKWVHVGYRASGNRRQVLIATKNQEGDTVYMAYSDVLYKKIYGKGTRDISDKFFMPAIDAVTAIDETHDGGYEQEVQMARNACDNVPDVPQAASDIVHETLTENGLTIKLDRDGTEITLKIEVTVQ